MIDRIIPVPKLIGNTPDGDSIESCGNREKEK